MRTHPFFDGLAPTLHIAHRGGAALAPENTLAAFAPAVARYGTDMIELDVHPTADGEIVVFHDDTLERCTNGAGPVQGHTWADLQRLDAGFRFTPDAGASHPFRGAGVAIPRLSEVLTRFPDLRINLELKAGPRSAAAVSTLLELLRAHDALDRVCLGSEDDTLGAALHAAAPDACHFFPAQALTALVMSLKTGAAPVVDPRYRVLDMPFVWQGMRLIDPELLAACAERGLWVNAWTVDSPDEMRYLLHIGVGGIMTDRPDVLRQVMDSQPKT
jgi:glycerophosphoryl diester phosphodiesterase